MWITILGLALLDSLSFASIVVTIFLLLSTAYRPNASDVVFFNGE